MVLAILLPKPFADCSFNSFPYYQDDPQIYTARVSTYSKFLVEGCNVPLGYMLPATVEGLQWPGYWKVDSDARTITLYCRDEDEDTATVHSKSIAQTMDLARSASTFRVLKGWRNELYPVYGPNRELLLNIERAACPLFGVVTYGVHMMAYVQTREGMKLWVPRRARNKQTYGGMLDNTVAGGISTGEEPFESLVREAAEEASLPEDLVRKRAKAVGTVTYFYVRDERAGGETGLLQPECQYVYDLEVGEDVVPKPGDNEVEKFHLWTVEEIQVALGNGDFKPNCALVMLDFFVRHGILTQANEKDYIEIVSRLHRRLDFPTA